MTAEKNIGKHKCKDCLITIPPEQAVFTMGDGDTLCANCCIVRIETEREEDDG